MFPLYKIVLIKLLNYRVPVSYGILKLMVYWPLSQFSSMVYWTPLLKKCPPLYGKVIPCGILNPLISKQEIVEGGGQYTIGGCQYSPTAVFD